MFDFKTLLVERPVECPMCGKALSLGDIMYEDKDRSETVCGYCLEYYKQDVISEEGEDGRLLK